MRKTYSLIQVAMALMDEPDKRHWGYDISKRAGVRSGVLYPILGRMLDEGWVNDGWEDRAEILEKRPARRYYKLTAKGQAELSAILDGARSDVRFAALVGRLA